ncbi:hypothetical protein PA598K_00822 [Paenibacillus sp. 598K]|uniref:cupin domain-containing protein n=1 Tax=Paenibacillus sp. 598K TaxID=1117987 RepID=UPI000FF99A94|nr:cupin domain-containing protein [Paenibacillus sp. 598K]GBF72565.1 hypothetical protein PA598K_00822 [Paenibacillus sp. 598K]
MTALPRTVQHRYTSESITFVETAEESGGAYLLIEVALPPRGKGPPLHLHDRFTEQFEVRQGHLTVVVKQEEVVLEAGQSLLVPQETAHTFKNNHDEPVVFRVRLTPPLQFEASVRVHYGLMGDGLTDEQGNPKNLYHVALILMLQNTWVAEKPRWLQRVLFRTLVMIGKRTGAFKPLEKYTQKPIVVP